MGLLFAAWVAGVLVLAALAHDGNRAVNQAGDAAGFRVPKVLKHRDAGVVDEVLFSGAVDVGTEWERMAGDGDGDA